MHYEARFISRNTNATGETFDLWHFASSKTGRRYIVNVEIYGGDLHFVKFFPRQYKGHPDRFSVLTGDNEPRTIVRTIIHILVNYARNNASSSFAFIAASCNGEGHSNTKRFRFYSHMMEELFDSEQFSHHTNEELSLYMMLRRTEMDARRISPSDIENFIYDNFDV